MSSRGQMSPCESLAPGSHVRVSRPVSHTMLMSLMLVLNYTPSVLTYSWWSLNGNKWLPQDDGQAQRVLSIIKFSKNIWEIIINRCCSFRVCFHIVRFPWLDLSLTRTRVACHTATLCCSGGRGWSLVTTHGTMGTLDVSSICWQQPRPYFLR